MPPDTKSNRAYALHDGDVMTVNEIYHLEYEDKLFYEVEEDGKDDFFNTKWKRTGKVLTIDDVNKLCK